MPSSAIGRRCGIAGSRGLKRDVRPHCVFFARTSRRSTCHNGEKRLSQQHPSPSDPRIIVLDVVRTLCVVRYLVFVGRNPRKFCPALSGRTAQEICYRKTRAPGQYLARVSGPLVVLGTSIPTTAMENPVIRNDSSRHMNGHSRSVVSSSGHLKSNDLDEPNYTNGNGTSSRHQHEDDAESTGSEDKKLAAQPRTTRARNGITKPRFEVRIA